MRVCGNQLSDVLLFIKGVGVLQVAIDSKVFKDFVMRVIVWPHCVAANPKVIATNICARTRHDVPPPIMYARHAAIRNKIELQTSLLPCRQRIAY